MTELRSRLAPLIFLMRDSSLRSIGPNLAKSTLGQGIRPSPAPPPPAAAGRLGRLRLGLHRTGHHGLGEGLHVVLRDAALGTAALDFVQRHAEFAGELAHRGRGMRQAQRGRAGGVVGGRGSSRRGGGSRCGRWRRPLRRGGRQRLQRQLRPARRSARGAFQHRQQVADVDLVAELDLEFLDHTGVRLDGISIEALSDSTVIRLCSTLTVSPSLTSTSITATSLKSPMSGTRTSTGPAAAAAAGAGAATDSGAAAQAQRGLQPVLAPKPGQRALRRRQRLPAPAPPSLA